MAATCINNHTSEKKEAALESTSLSSSRSLRCLSSLSLFASISFSCDSSLPKVSWQDQINRVHITATHPERLDLTSKGRLGVLVGLGGLDRCALELGVEEPMRLSLACTTRHTG